MSGYVQNPKQNKTKHDYISDDLLSLYLYEYTTNYYYLGEFVSCNQSNKNRNKSCFVCPSA